MPARSKSRSFTIFHSNSVPQMKLPFLEPLIHFSRRGWLIAACGFGIAPAWSDPLPLLPESVTSVAADGPGLLELSFRLGAVRDISEVAATSETASVPASSQEPAACAWMMVIDTSDPGRAATIAKAAADLKSLMLRLPRRDSVSVSLLARDLEARVPFTQDPTVAAGELGQLKPGGDAALTTLIYTNLIEAVEKLKARPEPAKTLVILSDGKDESPTDEAREASKRNLVTAAHDAGIVIHSLGYAESADGQRYFAGLKDIARETGGTHAAAALDTRTVTPETLEKLAAAMQGPFRVRLDVTKLAEPTEILVTVKTTSNEEGAITVTKDEVAKAIPTPPSDALDDKESPEVTQNKTTLPTEEDKAESEAEPEPSVNSTGEPALPEAGTELPFLEGLKADNWALVRKWWWAVATVFVILLILLVGLAIGAASRRKRRTSEAPEDLRLRPEPLRSEASEDHREGDGDPNPSESHGSSHPTGEPEAPLAWIEMCDADQTRHAVRAPNLRIGRGIHNDLVLTNDSVSANHCVIQRSRHQDWLITDLQSGNGIIVNGERVTSAILNEGDVIELGDLRMRFYKAI